MSAGSLINLMGDNSAAEDLKVGDGVTLVYWTDRQPFTVIDITKSGKTITIQEDNAERVDSNGMSDAQSYEYSRNPEGRVLKARLTKRGFRVGGAQGNAVVRGRNKYYDYSF